MNHGITSTQARTVSITDMVIYNEVDTINRAIIAAALAGDLQVTVDDGTTMTESTPAVILVGEANRPVIGVTDEDLVVNGQAITLVAGSDIYAIVGAITDAAVPGLTAAAVNGNVVLTYEPPMDDWSFEIGGGGGSAHGTLGFTPGVYTSTTVESPEYYSMWIGTEEDRKKSYAFAQVVNYFQSLGYNILAKKNTVTENTFKWEVYW